MVKHPQKTPVTQEFPDDTSDKIQWICEQIAEVCQVEVEDILWRKNHEPIKLARWVFVYAVFTILWKNIKVSDLQKVLPYGVDFITTQKSGDFTREFRNGEINKLIRELKEIEEWQL